MEETYVDRRQEDLYIGSLAIGVAAASAGKAAGVMAKELTGNNTSVGKLLRFLFLDEKEAKTIEQSFV